MKSKRFKRLITSSITLFTLGLLIFSNIHYQEITALKKTDNLFSITLILSGQGYYEIIEEVKEVGDFFFENITLKAEYPGDQALISGFKSEMGKVTDFVYDDTPFFSFQSNKSANLEWWPYWVNTTYLYPFSTNISFDILLDNSTIQPLTYCYNSLYSQLGCNLTKESSLPLEMVSYQWNGGGWLVYGYNQTSTEENDFSQSLYLEYTQDGFLSDIFGESFSRRGSHSCEYNFSWRTIEFIMSPTEIEQLSLWNSLFSHPNILFGSVILGVISVIFIFRERKNQ